MIPLYAKILLLIVILFGIGCIFYLIARAGMDEIDSLFDEVKSLFK